jgi:hypothetical protein
MITLMILANIGVVISFIQATFHVATVVVRNIVLSPTRRKCLHIQIVATDLFFLKYHKLLFLLVSAQNLLDSVLLSP